MSEERHDMPPPPESVATPAAAPKPQPITDQVPTMIFESADRQDSGS